VKAEKMFQTTTELAATLGIDTRRIRLEWISSAEAGRFVEVAREFTEQARTLGPANLKVAA
jgi:F420-non-reducing hydrogenase iron-sulfur subunit